MRPHNKFSINLNQQKSKAKRRLKDVRQGNDSALTLVKKFYPRPETLSAKSIRLADVQLALARELGVSSWSKLKAHIKELDLHKHAINNEKQTLDNELSTLHVRCGHDIQESLKISGFEGEFLPMIDPLCIGPIPSNENEFVTVRAKYVVNTLLPVLGRKDSVKEVAQSEQVSLSTLRDSRFERIVFWVEHDSYDQLMLLRGLTLLEHETSKVIEIIELNQFPGMERFIGFGQLPVEAIRSRWQRRKPVHAKLMNQAKTCWKALQSPSPDAIIDLLACNPLDCLPNIESVFKRLLQELPHLESGLSLTQHLALTVLSEQQGPMTVKECFKQCQQREPLPFLGDIMFYALLLPLTVLASPLITIDFPDKDWLNQNFTLTVDGLACLAGKTKISQEYWVGGIHISEKEKWLWDHQNLSSFKQETPDT